MINKTACNATEVVGQRSIEIGDVCDEDCLMVLSATRKHCGHKRNAEASALIAKKIGQTGSLVVLVFRQIGIRKLACRNEQESDPKALKHPSPCFVPVVGCQIEAREVPHGAHKHCETKADHPGDRNPSYQTNDQRRHHDDHHCTRPQDEASVCRRVTVEGLQHLRNQDGRAE